MRCTGCGLPLSPQRTHCPRCGKAAAESGKQEELVNNQAGVPQFAFSALQENSNMPAGAETIQGQPNPIAQQQVSNQMPDQIFYSAGTEQFSNQANQLPLDQDRTHLSNPEQPASWQSPSQSNQRGSLPSEIRPGEFQPFPYSPQRPGQTHSRPKVQLGFTIAGLCVLSGGFILMLVYIISLNLPSLSTNNQLTSSTATNTPATQNTSSGIQGGLPATTPPASLPTATPTPSFPGKAYIDNVQMASSIDMNTALPSQPTTTFTMHQKIFVTFMVHPVNSGAVCLSWYVNQKQFSQFPFDVGAIPQHAYSFTYAPSAGSGSVNIYWASSTTCTDEQLAQTVNFTITP